MLATIEHRGPDDSGSVMLGSVGIGMQRLSILDTSELGHQPMRSASGRSWIVYNGEIYNFLELAGQLEQLGHRFSSRSDTEVLLAAYEAWGIGCVERFNGIWAFAIWDTATSELHLSRDRFGVKPLFVVQQGGRLAFASEIKALLALDWVPVNPDPAVLRAFLEDGLSDHVDRTSFDGIHHLPAATVRTFAGTSVRDFSYWEPPEFSTDASLAPSRSDGRAVEEFRELLVDAVALQLRSDVSLGSCLSGGIDSSSIVSIASGLEAGRFHSSPNRLASRNAHQRLAFFADFDTPGISEREYVDAVVDRTGVELVTTTPSDSDFAEVIGQVVVAQDEPFASTSVVAQYFVMEAAKRSGVKVLLDGQGADEIVGGYPPYVAMRYAGALRAGGASSRMALRLLLGRQVKPIQTLAYALLGTRPLPVRLRRYRMDASMLGPELTDTMAPPSGVAQRPGTVLANALWRQLTSENLPALLRFEDRNSMAFGIEARVPFLDHRLIEYAFRLPDRLKISGTSQKSVLRSAMKGIVPDVVLGRRDKIAFRTPQPAWLRGHAARLVAGRSTAEAAGYLKLGSIDALVAGFLNGTVRDDHLWRAISLELWLRQVVMGPRK